MYIFRSDLGSSSVRERTTTWTLSSDSIFFAAMACYTCGSPDHYSHDCPSRKRAGMAGGHTLGGTGSGESRLLGDSPPRTAAGSHASILVGTTSKAGGVVAGPKMSPPPGPKQAAPPLPLLGEILMCRY